jgi:primosomal protein N' (replication factor Y)
VPKEYSYIVPEELREDIAFGCRVEVPLKNKLYSALVTQLHDELHIDYRPRKIVSLIDTKPIIDSRQYKLWKWISSYYVCTIGEVMNVALPSGLKLTSETKIYINPNFDENYQGLTDEEYMIAEAVHLQTELTINEIRSILDKKTVYPVIRALLDKEVVYVKEELKSKYKPKKIGVVRLVDKYKEDKNLLSQVLDQVARSEKQTKTILAIYQLSKKSIDIPNSDIYELSGSNSSVLKALEKKGIIALDKVEVSRLLYKGIIEKQELPPLSDDQQQALAEIKEAYTKLDQVLLHGVTGSGKTRVYIDLIQEQLDLGKQVLYLLPEIALTTQIVERMRAAFGDQVGVYHSKMSNAERVELWKAAADEQPIIIGARSSLFLPFNNLGLVIVDEEHDSSYKQHDPAPRYNGRDVSIVLASLYKCKVLLGTATPSLESAYNAELGKYGLVSMRERFGKVELPEIQVVDLKKQYKQNLVKSGFSRDLRDGMLDVLERGEQVMIFQNRRGYAPTLSCDACGWHAECTNCDVSLTVHKYFDELKCHYCGLRKKMILTCPACGTPDPTQRGIGTEKIELEILKLFPDYKVARMDYDTTKAKGAYETILTDFANKKIDILVGTQMITKGLDFEHVGIVGILNADMTLQFPDFRSGERAFQLFTQVSGRAGRKHRQGQVIIQTFQPTHPVILETIDGNFGRFFKREMKERQRFVYPPYFRLIDITLKHKQAKTVAEAALYFSKILKHALGNRVIGPSQPGVARLRGMYLQKVLIKLEKDGKAMNKIKSTLIDAKNQTQISPGFKSVRININVDPM